MHTVLTGLDQLGGAYPWSGRLSVPAGGGEAAILLIAGALHPVTLYDLSHGGAGVSARVRLKPGAEAMQATSDGPRPACRVARLDSERVGLLFWPEMAEADLNTQMSSISGLAARAA